MCDTPSKPGKPEYDYNTEVTNWYRSYLGRDPDAKGLEVWSNQARIHGSQKAYSMFQEEANKELANRKPQVVHVPSSKPPPPPPPPNAAPIQKSTTVSAPKGDAAQQKKSQWRGVRKTTASPSVGADVGGVSNAGAGLYIPH